MPAAERRVRRLVRTAGAALQAVQVRFGDLSVDQRNWKPGPDRWSVAQCLEHLVVSNTAYFPTFEQVVRGEKVSTLWERFSVLPRLWGALMVRVIGPVPQRRLPAPQRFQPAASAIDSGVIERFAEQQRRLIGYMEAMRGWNLERIVITSPVARVITYNLMDTYTFLIAHERRHIRQATRVRAQEGFP